MRRILPCLACAAFFCLALAGCNCICICGKCDCYQPDPCYGRMPWFIPDAYAVPQQTPAPPANELPKSDGKKL